MAINAYKKFKNTLYNRLIDYRVISERTINDKLEIQKVLEKGIVSVRKLAFFKHNYNFVESEITESQYENGLVYLKGKIIFSDKHIKGNLHTVDLKVLIADNNDIPLVNIIIEKEKKAIEQLLINSVAKDDIFLDCEKNIEIKKTTIYVNGECGSTFETYTNLKERTLMLEKYRQCYEMSNYENTGKDLLDLCGCCTRDLEIIYRKERPIFAQLSNKRIVEIAGYDPNSQIDATFIVNRINEEVDAINDAINKTIDEQLEVLSDQKKLVKKEKNN